MSQENKSETPVILVTGGTRGIGLAISLECVKRGATVAMNFNRDVESATAALTQVTAMFEEIQKAKEKDGTSESSKSITPAPPKLFQGDLRSASECKKVFDAVVAVYGRVDGLVNNSGINPDHDMGDPSLSFEEYSSTVAATMEVNFSSCSNMSFLALRQFQKQVADDQKGGQLNDMKEKKGVLVHITSRASHRGELTCPAYAASKSAMNIFGQSLAQRFAPEKILSFCIAPGWVKTAMAASVLSGPSKDSVLAQHPLGRVAEPEEIANVACYCLFDAPPALTGNVFDVNGASYLSC